MADKTIVWLNGPSRNDLLKAFPIQKNEIGCNFIRRDRPVHHVVSFDQGMVRQTQNTWSKVSSITPETHTKNHHGYWCHNGRP